MPLLCGISLLVPSTIFARQRVRLIYLHVSCGTLFDTSSAFYIAVGVGAANAADEFACPRIHDVVQRINVHAKHLGMMF